MYKLHSIAAALFLMVVTPKARAWEIGSMSTAAANPTARSILKVHNELQDGVPSYIAYFVSTNEAIVLSSPDAPGMQFLRKILDDAYLNGKKLTVIRDLARPVRTDFWPDANDATLQVKLYDIYPGDSVVIRTK